MRSEGEREDHQLTQNNYYDSQWGYGEPSDLVVSIKVWFLPYFDWVGGLFSDKNHTFLKYSNSSRNAKKFFFHFVHPPPCNISEINKVPTFSRGKNIFFQKVLHMLSEA